MYCSNDTQIANLDVICYSFIIKSIMTAVTLQLLQFGRRQNFIVKFICKSSSSKNPKTIYGIVVYFIKRTEISFKQDNKNKFTKDVVCVTSHFVATTESYHRSYLYDLFLLICKQEIYAFSGLSEASF